VAERSRTLGALVRRYTLLRLGVFAAAYAVAAVIIVPLAWGHRGVWLLPGVPAIAISLVVAYVLGKGLRAEISDAIDAQRAAARSRADDNAARIEAARARRQGQG
jgi:hypothetical protein